MSYLFICFNEDFVHLMADHIDELVYDNTGTEVKLKMNYKLQHRALLAYYHEVSYKNGGGINITS